MREQVIKITSDLSGTVYEGTDVPQVKITVNDGSGAKTGTRDLTPDESAAFLAWVTADAETLTAARTALRLAMGSAGTPAPAPGKPGRKRASTASATASKGADPRNAAIREWAATPDGRKEIGIPDGAEVATRGRLPREYAEAYDRARPNGYIPAAA